MERKHHWDNIYTTKDLSQVSWYKPHLEISLQLIAGTGVGISGHIIDVGGGTATLVDDLLARGFQHLTVLDISEAAIRAAQARLGEQASQVTWLEADITQAVLPQHFYDVWHDRAVFHFLTAKADREKYVNLVKQAVKPGGHVIIATFAADGPRQCSGLDVMRYDPDGLHGEFGDDFQLVHSLHEIHDTPFTTQQKFTYCYCRR